MVLTGVLIEPALTKLLAQVFIGISVYLVLNYFLGRSVLVGVVHLARQMIRLPGSP